MKYLHLIILAIALHGCELADPPNPPTPPTDCIPMDFLHDINADTQQALGNTFEPPANSGTMQGDPSLPQTLIRPAGVNAPMLEIIRLQEELGVVADFKDTAQLAKAMEQGVIPDATQFSMVRDVLQADVGFQAGQYIRCGQFVWFRFRTGWTNTVPASDALTLRMEMPFVQDNAEAESVRGVVFYRATNFRTQNQLLGFTYELEASAGDSDVEAHAMGTLGTAAVSMRIGDGDGDGAPPRGVDGMIVYPTLGVRNERWPFVEWVATGDQPHLVLPEITYYGAQAGDCVSVRDSADVEVQCVAVVGLPSATIPIDAALTKAGGSPYTLVHRGQRSRPLVVLAP